MYKWWMGPLRDQNDGDTTSDEGSPEVQKLQAQLKEKEDEAEKFKKLLMSNAGTPQQAPPPPQAPPQVNKKELEAAFWKDPLTMSSTIANVAARQAADQVYAATYETMVDAARSKARGTDVEFFDKYVAAIEEKVSFTAPQFRTNVNIWTNAMNLVRGERFQELLTEEQKKVANGEGKAPAIRVGPSEPSSKQAKAPPKTPLTDEERLFINKFGLTEDEYRRGKDSYERQESRIDKASSWDDVVTFDSEKKRKKNAA